MDIERDYREAAVRGGDAGAAPPAGLSRAGGRERAVGSPAAVLAAAARLGAIPPHPAALPGQIRTDPERPLRHADPASGVRVHRAGGGGRAGSVAASLEN